MNKITTIQALWQRREGLRRFHETLTPDRLVGSPEDLASEAVCHEMTAAEERIAEEIATSLDDLLIQAECLARQVSDNLDDPALDHDLETRAMRGLLRSLRAMTQPAPAALVRAAE